MKDIFSAEKRGSRYCIALMLLLIGVIVSPIMCLLLHENPADYAGDFIAYLSITYLVYLVLDIALEYVLHRK